MKLNVQHHNLRSTHELDSLIEERILALQPRLQIDEAKIRLECRLERKPRLPRSDPPGHPGPDVLAEGRDHTIRAAIAKAVADIEAKLGDRARKPLRRLRSNLQTPAPLRERRMQS